MKSEQEIRDEIEFLQQRLDKKMTGLLAHSMQTRQCALMWVLDK
jgi:hypothetical protein